ncbi:slit3 protein-like [Tropilaelaps mercedesae]|uniref:Slit3 protein-like n=1 Tax=Tropilaelaps mercedesae TaxID=418985 RepID=A0A1V9XPD2_9ACAR|nr:slit3 protein-like [Tropilaelaps mercedesae]
MVDVRVRSAMTTQRSLVAVVLARALLLGIALVSSVQTRHVRPEDCTWEPIPDVAGVSMTCSVRTLQAGASPTNFSLIMPGHTVQLSVVCDNLIFQSELTNGSFEHLRGLESLTIERCKLEQIPPNAFDGLKDLKRLVLKTLNNEWGRFSLRVPAGAFAPLKEAEIVDLSENNINSLPPRLFCGLDRLRSVNLSGNAFHDASMLGFASTSRCRPAVHELDVTHSRLRTLSAGGFASLVHLDELRMEYNQISRVETDAFSGLSQLSRLDMSHNMLVALPLRLFRATPRLSELYMRNNSFRVLSAALFAGLHELTMLDLAHNQLSTLGWLEGNEAQSGLGRLSVLDLSHNRLTRLEANAFDGLRSLQTLQLHDNVVEFIADHAFGGLDNLQSLTLSHNRIKRVGLQTVAGVSAIMTLHLDHNQIDTIHGEAFVNLSMLQELNLAANELSTVPLIFSPLNMLRSLDLSDNRINDLANLSGLQGLGQLYALNLMSNQIGNLSQDVFSHLPSVRILNLANNAIQAIEQGTFDDVPGLHYLRLDSNMIEDVNALFSNLHDLIMLNMSVNHLRWFDYALIPVGLQWLDIHDNQIEALGNYFDLEQSLKLRTLDASFNKLTDLDASSLPNGIEIVFLKNNNIKLIQPFTFRGKDNLTRVDLTNNQLRVVEMATFRLSELTFSKNAKPTMPLLKVESSQFLCPYKRHCFSLCHCCDFDACDCEMVCPSRCSCYHHLSWASNVVDCSSTSNNEHSLRQLPMDVSEVYLDGNDIPEIGSHSFVGRKNLQVLFLNRSNVATVQNRSFVGLHELRVLRLEDNRIAELHGHEFDDLDKLSQLYLSNNQLRYVSNMTFARLKNLDILHLDRNRLVEISVWSLQYNPRLTELRLAGNPWTCDCRVAVDFTQFLFNERGNTVRDIFQLSCVYNETKALSLWELNVTECFGLSEATSLVRPFHIRSMGDLLPVVAVLGVLLVVVSLMAVAVGIVYRRKLSVWFFSRYGVRVCHRAPAEEEKLFDAFVSYSKKDEAFVAQILAPELECGSPPYRLCLHYRDLSMAGGYLSEAIQEAVESSRRTIVILSEHFLKSEWCRYEFKSAHYELLNNTSHKLIVIFLGRVSYRELDADIRMWLKQSTFLHWGEKNFWDKLRYSLPDARHRKNLRSDLNTVAVHI